MVKSTESLLERIDDMIEQHNQKFNSSHCKDLTAFEAVEKVSKEQTELDIKVYELIKTIKSIIRLAGFELVGRIQIKHRKTRKLFK
jgi:superfamily II helicase